MVLANCYDVSISLKEEAAWDERALAFVLDIRGMFQHVDAVMTENLFMVY